MSDIPSMARNLDTGDRTVPTRMPGKLDAGSDCGSAGSKSTCSISQWAAVFRKHLVSVQSFSFVIVLKRYHVAVSYTAWIRRCVLGSAVGVTGRRGLTHLDVSLLLRPWGDAVSLAGTRADLLM